MTVVKTIEDLKQFPILKLEDVTKGFDDTCCNYIAVRLNGRSFKYEEDPSDGWRSCCKSPVSFEHELYKNFSNKVYSVKVTENVSLEGFGVDYNFIGTVFIDCETLLPVLIIGTNYNDTYYPCYVEEYHPENMAINQDF